MKTIGNYDVKIFTDNVEDGAIEQLEQLLSLGTFSGCKIRVMPDVHKGAGCVIGFTGDLLSSFRQSTPTILPDLAYLEGFYSETVAPMVYKPKEEIIRNIAKTVRIENIIKPVYNFKAAM